MIFGEGVRLMLRFLLIQVNSCTSLVPVPVPVPVPVCVCVCVCVCGPAPESGTFSGTGTGTKRVQFSMRLAVGSAPPR